MPNIDVWFLQLFPFLRTTLSPTNLNKFIDIEILIRDAIIKEKTVKSGFLQIRGVGSRGPPDPDFLHVDQNVNPDYFLGGDLD